MKPEPTQAGNFLDRAIAAAFPGWALRRAQARVRLPLLAAAQQLAERRRAQVFRAGYEGASVGRRTAGWTAGGGSADSEIAAFHSRLRNRSRDLTRNNKWQVRALSSIESNIVGTGIMAAPRSANGRRNKRMLDLWRSWAETTECDQYGQSNLYALQLLVARGMAEAGEVLVRRRYVSTSEKLTVPIQLQVLEADHLDTARDGVILASGNRIRHGIEYDQRGRRVAYYLFPEHPGEQLFFQSWQSERVDARDVAHVFRSDRVGQGRGVPWAVAAMIALKDFDELEDAQLLRHKIANLFAGFERDLDGTAGAEPIIGQATSGSTDREMEPGAWVKMDPSKTIEFSDPPQVSGFREFAEVNLMGIAAAYPMPYEELTGDYSQVNFSSARMSRLAYQGDIFKWQWTTFIPRFCERIWAWFNAAAWEAGRVDDRCECGWTPPRPALVDPTREWPAYREAVRSGFINHSEAVREMGRDPDKLLEDYAEDQRRMAELGLSFDSNPDRPAQGGGGQTSAHPNEPADAEDDAQGDPEDDGSPAGSDKPGK